MAGIGKNGGEFFGLAGVDVAQDGGVSLVSLLDVRDCLDKLGFYS